MLNYTSMMMPRSDISTLLAEDAGAPELRNPLAGGMRGEGLLSRLVGFFGRLGR